MRRLDSIRRHMSKPFSLLPAEMLFPQASGKLKRKKKGIPKDALTSNPKGDGFKGGSVSWAETS